MKENDGCYMGNYFSSCSFDPYCQSQLTSSGAPLVHPAAPYVLCLPAWMSRKMRPRGLDGGSFSGRHALAQTISGGGPSPVSPSTRSTRARLALVKARRRKNKRKIPDEILRIVI